MHPARWYESMWTIVSAGSEALILFIQFRKTTETTETHLSPHPQAQLRWMAKIFREWRNYDWRLGPFPILHEFVTFIYANFQGHPARQMSSVKIHLAICVSAILIGQVIREAVDWLTRHNRNRVVHVCMCRPSPRLSHFGIGFHVVISWCDAKNEINRMEKQELRATRFSYNQRLKLHDHSLSDGAIVRRIARAKQTESDEK